MVAGVLPTNITVFLAVLVAGGMVIQAEHILVALEPADKVMRGALGVVIMLLGQQAVGVAVPVQLVVLAATQARLEQEVRVRLLQLQVHL